MQIAITGSSGLIGTALVTDLRQRGHEVIRLVRRAPAGAGEVRWDPGAPGGGLAPGALTGIGAAVNLAGAGVADRRWTESYKAEIRASRLAATGALASALTALDPPPAVLLQASAIGWYGDTGGREVDETSPAGTGFLPDLVQAWEGATGPVRDAGIRVVTMRTGLVLSPGGGMLARLLLPFRLGLGARLGPGTQAMSWITIADYLAAVAFLLATPELSGPVNLTAPHPATNAEFTAALGAALHRPAVLTVPTPALRLLLGEVSSDLLSSARVLPRRLLAAGYQFRYPRLPEALAALLAGPG
ncbi:MAG: TIGR01777 family oxidoreductase [Gemmatimonadota bacterium]